MAILIAFVKTPMITKIIQYPVLFFAVFFSMSFSTSETHTKVVTVLPATTISKNTEPINSSKYTEWKLDSFGISEKAFDYALKGFNFLHNNNRLDNDSILTIADFSKPSTQKRFCVIDIKNGSIIFNTLVAHGRNSGQVYASNYSNKESSLESSPGFYITSDTYDGKNGYSLKLAGCEKGFNDNAMHRGIVLHGAEYVSESFIMQNGFLGRSHGCPAVPAALSKNIIDKIKNGSCLFVYFPSTKYLRKSAILNS